MKRNRKLILMIIMTIVLIVVFTSRVDAVVMWMQCADKADDEFSSSDDFKYYSSFAVVNNKNNSSVRHLVYDSTSFYGGQKPTFVVYHGDNGNDFGDICWYNKEFDGIAKCNKEDDRIGVEELLDGYCPTQVIDNATGDTFHPVKGDMLVLQGKKKALSSLIEILPSNMLVIYRFKDSKNNTGIMIEGYDSSGKYGYVTTWEDWDSFSKNLKLKKNGDDSNDLVTESNYDSSYIDWTGMTQARRIAKFGRDYFKLLDDKRPWLVGAVDDQGFSVDDTFIYRSDDSNNKFFEWVSNWYREYSEDLSEQLAAMEDLEYLQEYKKLIDTAEKINEAINANKKYTFDVNYSSSQMITDLNDAYNKLKVILDSDNGIYNTYDDNCISNDKKSDDALASVITSFNCDTFGVPLLSGLEHGDNVSMLDLLLSSTLSDAINEVSNSSISLMSLRSKAEGYAILFETAIKYIRTYEVVTGDDEQTLLTLLDNYSKMTSEFGGEVIISCEDLIDKEFREKIGSYLNIVKLAVPIILILFGILEFTKAIFAGDEEQMKKAQKNFMIRLVIAIIFFLVPTIVDLLLGIANKVWNHIEPGSCGVFEIK